MLEDEARRVNRPYLLLEALVIKSLTLYSLQKNKMAFSVLREGLGMAAAQNIRRLFLNEGENMRLLLQGYKKTGIRSRPGSVCQFLIG